MTKNRCGEIEAHVRMEERYEGLSLIFGDHPELKEEILGVVKEVKEETGLAPFVFDKVSSDHPDIQAVYLEFHEDVHRDAGDFFERVLKKLKIDKCEADI
jgi:8-oxo-dGTP pyrophosphatase MutT (NUDIX family)